MPMSNDDLDRLLLTPDGDTRHPAWSLLNPEERLQGQQNLELIAGAAQI